ncbi:hypothetical protein [Flavobacterium sp.]|uniref:hypothetical protein n=1 Tax=Flavobacterium sp. TaxID=239 RepID=UPI00374DBA2A
MLDFLKQIKLSPEKKFWKYFLDNKRDLENFIDSDLSDYTAYNNLTDEIKKFSSLLFAEITKYSNGKYVLVVTPDGKFEGINDTQKLFDSKPEISNWIVEKFRQPKDKIQFQYDGLEYPSSDIEIFAELNTEKEKFDIQVFIRNMHSDEQKYQIIAWLYLDDILGEFNSITKIGYVDFFNLEEGKTVKNGITILELRKLIDREIYRVY